MLGYGVYPIIYQNRSDNLDMPNQPFTRTTSAVIASNFHYDDDIHPLHERETSTQCAIINGTLHN
jgi:hypothetical protein